MKTKLHDVHDHKYMYGHCSSGALACLHIELVMFTSLWNGNFYFVWLNTCFGSFHTRERLRI